MKRNQDSMLQTTVIMGRVIRKTSICFLFAFLWVCEKPCIMVKLEHTISPACFLCQNQQRGGPPQQGGGWRASPRWNLEFCAVRLKWTLLNDSYARRHTSKSPGTQASRIFLCKKQGWAVWSLIPTLSRPKKERPVGHTSVNSWSSSNSCSRTEKGMPVPAPGMIPRMAAQSPGPFW